MIGVLDESCDGPTADDSASHAEDSAVVEVEEAHRVRDADGADGARRDAGNH